ncbi:hypothetical protein PUN28_014981 [Cardiocondyla obscurior]|uniref:Uncharacterized protein n=1 Tax=Cardiocondyla obscurior TaxID=286306 RepID=A0AAW2F2C5_9HYME
MRRAYYARRTTMLTIKARRRAGFLSPASARDSLRVSARGVPAAKANTPVREKEDSEEKERNSGAANPRARTSTLKTAIKYARLLATSFCKSYRDDKSRGFIRNSAVESLALHFASRALLVESDSLFFRSLHTCF